MKVNQRDTKTRILDAAENLFAAKGFHNTSLREITKEAGVNLAAVNYHFGSKESLFEEVFKRHFLPVNRIRLARLEDIRDNATRDRSRPAARDVLQAFIAPVLHFRETEPGAAAFVTLVIRTMSEHDDRLRDILMGYFRPTFLLCLDILCEALPHIPKGILFWRLQFSIGTMSHTLHMLDQSRMFPEGVVPVYDVESMTEMIVSFVTAGMETQ
jgi:AcrR family transcriptional regulator